VGARRSSVVIEEAKCEIISNHGGKYSLVGRAHKNTGVPILSST
jgi:hypothetical protein